MKRALNKNILIFLLGLLLSNCAHVNSRNLATIVKRNLVQNQCFLVAKRLIYGKKIYGPEQIPANLSRFDLAPSQLANDPLRPLSIRSINDAEIKLKKMKEIDIQDLGGGTNDSYLVRLEDGTKGVWKPHKLIWSSNYRAEVLAYELDQIFGFGLVPETVERTFYGEKGSLQLFKKKGYFNPTIDEAIKPRHDQFNDQSVFDFLINNPDRNIDNYFFSTDGDLVAIDHGMSFIGSSGPLDKAFYERIDHIDEFFTYPRAEKILAQIRQALGSAQIKLEIENFLGLEDSKNLFGRMQLLISYHDMTKNKGHALSSNLLLSILKEKNPSQLTLDLVAQLTLRLFNKNGRIDEIFNQLLKNSSISDQTLMGLIDGLSKISREKKQDKVLTFLDAIVSTNKYNQEHLMEIGRLILTSKDFPQRADNLMIKIIQSPLLNQEGIDLFLNLIKGKNNDIDSIQNMERVLEEIVFSQKASADQLKVLEELLEEYSSR